MHKQFPETLNGEVFIVKGVVVGLPSHHRNQRKQQVQKFRLKITELQPLNRQLNHSLVSHRAGSYILLSWYSYRADVAVVRPGDLLQLTVKLKRPRGFVNPAGFDYQLYLLQQNIMATGYVRGKTNHKTSFLRTSAIARYGLIVCAIVCGSVFYCILLSKLYSGHCWAWQ